MTVLTATRINSWAGSGCRSDERWVTLIGPKGATQQVRLVGAAYQQALKNEKVLEDLEKLKGLVGELSGSLREMVECLEIKTADPQNLRYYDTWALDKARAVLRKLLELPGEPGEAGAANLPP